jgi:hypothetical protein
MLGLILVIVGIILAFLDIFLTPPRAPWLLNAAVILIGFGVIFGVHTIVLTQ